MMGLSTAFYAKPDYSKLSQQPGTSKDKPVITLSGNKPGIKITQKNNSHHFKSRVLNSTRPVQRCIKALKI
jgi:hypothetical protein